ncbi:MAG: 30S ribosomal protein S4 [Candidatus Portnoybacteria bacterium]|nr:30S ribosomal protein S4 [Candidatus Portnoybacteria bacterium]
MRDPQCKKCRRAGEKLFLKGERCFTPKCAIVKKPYAPGLHGKKRRRGMSEYGAQLLEKQKLKNMYEISEKQLLNYYKKASGKEGVLTEELIKSLETRLDSIVFRLGWTDSRRKARQIVSHGHILLNNRKTDIPSVKVRKDDIVSIKEKSLKSPMLKNLEEKLKKHETPEWLSLNKEKTEGKMLREPKKDEIEIPVDLSMIVEFYSR